MKTVKASRHEKCRTENTVRDAEVSTNVLEGLKTSKNKS
jgi:hypothetical protein